MYPVGNADSIITKFGGRKNTKKYPECGTSVGVEIRAEAGDPVVAARRGTVLWVNYGRGYGAAQIAMLGDDGAVDFYGYLSSREVPHGTFIEAGTMIGTVDDDVLYFQRLPYVNAPWCDAEDPTLSLDDEQQS